MEIENNIITPLVRITNSIFTQIIEKVDNATKDFNFGDIFKTKSQINRVNEEKFNSLKEKLLGKESPPTLNELKNGLNSLRKLNANNYRKEIFDVMNVVGWKIVKMENPDLKDTSEKFRLVNELVMGKEKAIPHRLESLYSNSRLVGQKIADLIFGVKAQSIYESIIFNESGKEATIVKKKFGIKITRDFQVNQQVGKGGFGTVVLLKPTPKWHDIILKQNDLVIKNPNDKDAIQELGKSKTILLEQHINPHTGKRLRHVPGVMTLVKFSVKEGIKEGSQLQTFFNKDNLTRFGGLPPKELINATSQLIFGLNHLHTDTPYKPGRAHRDIKPKNIFCREIHGKKEYVMGDMDGAHLLNNLAPKVVSSEQFVSKNDLKMLENKPYDSLPADVQAQYKDKAEYDLLFPSYDSLSNDDKIKFNKSQDIYAMGLSLKEMLGGRDQETLKFENLPKKVIDRCSPAEKEQLTVICDLVNKMIDSDWTQRCTANEALDTLKNLGIKIPKYS